MEKYKNNESILVLIYVRHIRHILMLQRKDDLDFWQSVTGSLEIGELPIQAAEREVREETGLQISQQNRPLVDCKTTIEFEIFPHFRYKYAPNVTHCKEHWFLLEVEEEFEPTLTEHLAYQWMSVEQAIQMTKSPNNAAAIRKYLTP